MDAAIRNQGASIKSLEIQIGQMSKVLQERGFGSLPSSTETNPRDQVNLDNHYCDEEVGNYEQKFAEACGASHINDTIPRKEKDPRSFTLPFFINNVCFDNVFVDLGSNISFMPLLTYLNLGLGELAHTRLIVELADRTVKYPKGIAENVLVGIGKFTFLTALRVGEEKIVFTSIKSASSLIRRVYMLSLRERTDLDLEARLMGETLVLNRSLDHFLEDYIKLNDLNEPFELRRNQGDDLISTIEEGKVIEEFRTKNDELNTGINDYPSYCDDDMKINIDCAHNLKFSCMIRFEFTHANFFPLLYVNVMSKEFQNSIMKDKMVYNEVGIKAKRFEGMITLYNGNDEVTYQMVRSHPRFKQHINKQCNKIPPLLKVSENDEKNEVLHAYQKLKGFYKGVLNLGPDYIRNTKTEEWLTRGHLSVHGME
ncbi:putative reverse transcriptase domain-containing protein [Tanacetum coccineum]